MKATLFELETATVEEKEQMLDTILRSLEGIYRRFTPLYPWVLVRVLPKQRMYGMLHLPEKQNKVTHEGIVVATWQPTATHPMPSALKPGDHALFAHFAGLPIPGWQDDRYRIVKEEAWAKDGEGGIHSVVEYADDFDFEQVISSVLDPAIFDGGNGFDSVNASTLSELRVRILERFVLIDKQTRSVTLSGR